MDSLASMILLREAGHEILPIHARFFPKRESSRELSNDLERICNQLGLKLLLLDLGQTFGSYVIHPFIRDYLQGLTPNPCAGCNKNIKFGALLEKAREWGADYLATGHYAAVKPDSSGTGLWRGKDPHKEQSYFLSLVPETSLRRAVFPLQDKHKSWTADFLSQKNIPTPAREESNEICFIPGDYRDFIAQQVGDKNLPGSGPIKDTRGQILGYHLGLWRYTPGQRRGLGIAHNHPLYVLGKDHSANTLIVGSKDELGSWECSAREVNFLVPFKYWPPELWVQTRYRQNPQPANVEIQGTRMRIHFRDHPQIPAPGQVAAIYSSQGRVLAGGIIEQKPS